MNKEMGDFLTFVKESDKRAREMGLGVLERMGLMPACAGYMAVMQAAGAFTRMFMENERTRLDDEEAMSQQVTGFLLAVGAVTALSLLREGVTPEELFRRLHGRSPGEPPSAPTPPTPNGAMVATVLTGDGDGPPENMKDMVREMLRKDRPQD